MGNSACILIYLYHQLRNTDSVERSDPKPLTQQVDYATLLNDYSVIARLMSTTAYCAFTQRCTRDMVGVQRIGRVAARLVFDRADNALAMLSSGHSTLVH